MHAAIFNRNAFLHLIDRRIGKERVAEYLEGVSRSEFYVRAAQRSQLLAKGSSELFLEFQFTKLFKSLEGYRFDWIQ